MTHIDIGGSIDIFFRQTRNNLKVFDVGDIGSWVPNPFVNSERDLINFPKSVRFLRIHHRIRTESNIELLHIFVKIIS